MSEGTGIETPPAPVKASTVDEGPLATGKQSMANRTEQDFVVRKSRHHLHSTVPCVRRGLWIFVIRLTCASPRPPITYSVFRAFNPSVWVGRHV